MMRGFALLASAALLAAQTSTGQRAPGEPDRETAALEGTVLDPHTGERVKKAAVRLGGSNGPSMRAITDAGGRFVFRRLPAGTYWLSAGCDGYTAPEPENTTTSVTLAAGEQKSGMELPLVRLASLGGRVLDEFGAGLAGCDINAVQYAYQPGGRRLHVQAGAFTNPKGEYSFQGLQPGRYYLFLRCHAQFPAPHPLLPRGDPRIPLQVYARQFYPGVPDVSGATRMEVGSGLGPKGVDFQVRRVGAVTVTGRLAGMESGAMPQVSVVLIPQAAVPLPLTTDGTKVERDGSFRFSGIRPGSYLLVASATINDAPAYYAEVPVEIGDVPPEPLEVAMSAAWDAGGTIESEHETVPAGPQSAPAHWPDKAPVQIGISPLGTERLAAMLATAADDGSFTLSGVLPGRWRLNVFNAPGFVKEFTIGDQTVSPNSFEIAAGQKGPWRIVVSKRTAQVDVTVSDTLPPQRNAAIILLARDDLQFSGAESTAASDEQGHATFTGVRPGRYRVYAVETRQSSRLLQKQFALQALNLRSETIDVEEAGRAQVSVGLIREDDLTRALQEAE